MTNTSIQSQNWAAILGAASTALGELDGPFDGATWDEFGGDAARDDFQEAVTEVLNAELGSRTGQTSTVSVDIKAALTTLGEQLAKGAGEQQETTDA